MYRVLFVLMCLPFNLQAQDLADRNWHDVQKEQRWVIGEEKLLDPINLRVFNGEIFVRDEGDEHLKRFNAQGDLLNTVGKGVGQGPGEFQIMFDYALHKDEVFIVDERGSRIHRYKKDGDYIESYLTSPQHQRIAPAGEMLALVSIYKSDPFTLFSVEGEEIREFGKDFGDKVTSPPSLDGQFIQGDDEILYLPFYAARIFVYDTDGQQNRVVTTVDEFDFLESGSHSRGFSAPDWDVSNREGSIDGEYLYIRVRARTDDGMISIMDRYTWPEGEYLDSFQLPSNFGRVRVSGDVMYVVNRDEATLSAYEFEW